MNPSQTPGATHASSVLPPPPLPLTENHLSSTAALTLPPPGDGPTQLALCYLNLAKQPYPKQLHGIVCPLPAEGLPLFL